MNPTAGLESQNLPSFYAWQVPGKPLSVLLSYGVVDRLLREALRGLGAVPRRGAEIGGLLLGSAQRGEKLVVRIEDYWPVPCEYCFGPSYVLSEGDRQSLGQALEKWKPSPARAIYAVGYYRSHTRKESWLGEEDVWLFSTYFSDSTKVALVIKPRVTSVSVGGFFFWERGEVRAESTYLEFPFDRRALGGGEPPPAGEDAPPAGRAETAAEESSHEPELGEATPGSDFIPLPSFLTGPPPQTRKSRVESLWVRMAILAALLSLGSWLGFLAARQYHRWVPKSIANDPFSLGLAVMEYGDNLHLSWNRNAPAIRIAERGILLIADGDQNRSLELDEGQLRNGSVIYRRLAGPIRFRLEVFLRGGNRSVTETWEPNPPPALGPTSH
jgi:hypothetical protein